MEGRGRNPESSTYGSSTTNPTSSGGTTDQIKQKGSELAGQVQDKAAQAAEKVQEVAKPRLEHGKETVSHQLTGVADALRQTGSQLRDGDQTNVADYLDWGARRIERVSGYLDQRDIGELLDETEQFVRRQPALFLAGALALGFIGARFLKASQERRYSGYDRYDRYDRYDDESMYGGAGPTRQSQRQSSMAGETWSRPMGAETPESRRPMSSAIPGSSPGSMGSTPGSSSGTMPGSSSGSTSGASTPTSMPPTPPSTPPPTPTTPDAGGSSTRPPSATERTGNNR